jgi:hypothetical protein
VARHDATPASARASLELRPTPNGVTAHFFVDDKETKKQKLDLSGNRRS